jgi:hypothetical protein
MRNFLGLCLMLALCAVLRAETPFVFQPSNENDPFENFSEKTLEGVTAPSNGLLPVGSRIPGSLDEVIISAGFDDDVAQHTLPVGWSQIDLDSANNFDPDVQWWNGPSVWQKISRVGITTHSGSGVCVNIWNSNQRPNDDWLILPQIPALRGTISFSYWVSSQDGRNPEAFEVRVSTTGNQAADFTDLIYAEVEAPHLWTQHTHNLTTYVGAPFYIAIHHISTNRYFIKVDDVQLTGTRLSAPDNESDNLPDQFTFAGNFPNPFNNQTEFRFELPRPAKVSLVIYTMLGQECASVVNSRLDAGAHTVAFSAAALPSGVYFTRLTAAGWTQTRKMLLLK